MAVDYQKLCVELFGTDDVEELRRIAKEREQKNSRGAGRKKAVSQTELEMMRIYESKGMSYQEIGKRFHISRQTVNKYLNKVLEWPYTMQIDYMLRNKVCTTIMVDFLNEKVKVYNRTDDILHRAFGVVEEPTWQDFQDFLEERCYSKDRGDLKDILKRMDIDSYDPLQICEKTEGRVLGDHQWMRFKYRSYDENNSTV